MGIVNCPLPPHSTAAAAPIQRGRVRRGLASDHRVAGDGQSDDSRPATIFMFMIIMIIFLGGSVAPSLSDRPMRVLRDSKHKSSARCTLAATILWRWTLLFLATSHVLPIAQFKDSWLMLSFSPHLISLRTHESSTRGRTTEMELLPLGNAAANYPISSESNRSTSATDLSQ